MEAPENLRAWIARESPIPVGRAASVARRVADAVAARHAEGRPAGPALDAERIAISWTAAGEPVIDLPDLPELAASADPAPTPDPADDMPKIGAILYELLAGSPPPARRAPPPVQRVRPDLPESLGWLVMQCFHPGPAGRPRSAEEVSRRLEPFEASENPARDSSRTAVRSFGQETSALSPLTGPVSETPAPGETASLVPDPGIDVPLTRPIPVPAEPPRTEEPAAPPPLRPPPPAPRALDDRTLARSAFDEPRGAIAGADGRDTDREEPRGARPLVIWSVALAIGAVSAAAFWFVLEKTGPSPSGERAAAAVRARSAPASVSTPSEARSEPTARPDVPTPFPVVEVSPPPGAPAGLGSKAATPTAAAPLPRSTAAIASGAPAPPASGASATTPVPTPPPAKPTLAAPASEAEALREALDAWIDSTNRRDLSGHMQFYMPRVATFYLQHDVSRESVWEEKARLFEGPIEVSASSPEIELAADGKSATIRFRKRYAMTTHGTPRRGEVLQEMRWVKTARGWKIVGERDARELSRG